MDTILEMKHIVKTFPGVRAVDDVSISVKKGEVYALLGENGAGKSTLMKILDGIQPADSGEIIFDGQKVNIKSPSDALKLGISMIFQELNPIPELTIAENLIRRDPLSQKNVWYRRLEGSVSEKRRTVQKMGAQL